MAKVSRSKPLKQASTSKGHAGRHGPAATSKTVAESRKKWPAAPGRERCVVTLERGSAERVLPFGEDFIKAKFPAGTRVIYPPDPVEPVPDVRAAVRQALIHPLGSEPLYALLQPGMKVTIAVDDISLPLPAMARPDVRQVILEAVIEMLADYGVDDIEIIVAISLHRRMTEAEIRRMVGPRVFADFWPERLYNHDAEAPDGVVELGQTDHGEKAIINRRAAESDLIIYVNVNLVPMDGGHKSVGVGLTNYESLRGHHNPRTILDSWSFMDPGSSALSHSCTRIGEVVERELNIFHIETTLNNHMYGGPMSFLSKREDDWNASDDWAFRTLTWTLKKLPRQLKRDFFMRYRAPYGVTGVAAGACEPVHDRTLEGCFQQYAVPVKGQADVLVTGIPYLCPYNVNSIMNPLLVHCSALGYFFNMYRGLPLLKEGGVFILAHPLYDEFHAEHHPSYIEFFRRLLPESRDSAYLERTYEESFARDPSYLHLYRNGNAYHGAHPFYMWYWGEAGRAQAGKIICVGAESPRVAEVLGWDTAASIDDALAMARSFLGRSDPDITLIKLPPIVIADVT